MRFMAVGFDRAFTVWELMDELAKFTEMTAKLTSLGATIAPNMLHFAQEELTII